MYGAGDPVHLDKSKSNYLEVTDRPQIANLRGPKRKTQSHLQGDQDQHVDQRAGSRPDNIPARSVVGIQSMDAAINLTSTSGTMHLAPLGQGISNWPPHDTFLAVPEDWANPVLSTVPAASLQADDNWLTAFVSAVFGVNSQCRLMQLQRLGS